MGPITLFDKSFLQSLSVDESVFFDHFFLPVTCPLFYIETLADLEKAVRFGRTPEQEVGMVADKVPEMSGGACPYHIDMAFQNLLGFKQPMHPQIPMPGGRPVKVDGKVGFAHELSPEAEAFNRWQKGEFLYVERNFARAWRTALNAIDLVAVAAGMKAMGIAPQICKTLAAAKEITDTLLHRSDTVPDQIKLALIVLGAPLQIESVILEQWRAHGAQPLVTYAPYAAHVVAVELFFQIALGADLIGTEEASNRTDVAYLHYLPSCHMFVSVDKLHRRCASHFLRTDQSFVWGPDLKAALHRLMEHFATFPEEQKEQGLMRLAPEPPRDDYDNLVVQLWDRHLPKWRGRPSHPPPRDAVADGELVEHINRVSKAAAMSPSEADFEPKEAEFLQITRRISQRKGAWWQLPKHLKRD